MKKIIFVIFFLSILFPVVTKAQQQDTLKRDTTVVAPPLLDSTLVGKNIFDLLSEKGPFGASVTIRQSDLIRSALIAQAGKSSQKKLAGYRVRIYFDNNQRARNTSQDISAKFKQMYPLIPAYRTYTNPYFKVTVGDFRTKSEAMKLLKELEPVFPAAFLVKENINFPPL